MYTVAACKLSPLNISTSGTKGLSRSCLGRYQLQTICMSMSARLLTTLLLIRRVAGVPGTCRAGGAGYSLVFDGMNGTVLGMEWYTPPLTRLTLEYWVRILDVQLTQQTVFAYSVRSGAYEAANEFVVFHAPSYTRVFRGDSYSSDFPTPTLYGGSWTHVAVTWAADPYDSPHGQLALYIDGLRVANETVCPLGACGMGRPLKPGGLIHLGQDADAPYGEFDEFQALTALLTSYSPLPMHICHVLPTLSHDPSLPGFHGRLG